MFQLSNWTSDALMIHFFHAYIYHLFFCLFVHSLLYYWNNLKVLHFGVYWILYRLKMKNAKWCSSWPHTKTSPIQKCQKCRFQMSVIVVSICSCKTHTKRMLILFSIFFFYFCFCPEWIRKLHISECFSFFLYEILNVDVKNFLPFLNYVTSSGTLLNSKLPTKFFFFFFNLKLKCVILKLNIIF